VTDFRQWPWSSYTALAGRANTHLARDEVLNWYGSATEFRRFHAGQVDEARLQALIEDDFD
jgi:hypothetical protein